MQAHIWIHATWTISTINICLVLVHKHALNYNKKKQHKRKKIDERHTIKWFLSDLNLNTVWYPNIYTFIYMCVSVLYTEFRWSLTDSGDNFGRRNNLMCIVVMLHAPTRLFSSLSTKTNSHRFLLSWHSASSLFLHKKH